MDSIDSLKKHLDSAKNLKSIVSTMKALAATNIKKYEKTSLSLSKYLNNIYLGLQGIIRQNKKFINVLDFVEKDIEKDEKKQNIIIIVGSNQGLCGRFNDKIINFFIEDFKKNFLLNEKNTTIISIGDKIQMMLETNKIDIQEHIVLPNSIENIVHIVYHLFTIIEAYSNEFSSQNVFVYFTQFDSKSNGILTKKKIVPLDKTFFEKLAKKKWPTNNLPFWRVETKILISDLIQQYIFANVYFAIASSMAAEQKNRLITLQGAEDNIKDNISTTTLKYNQTRQTIITSELIDVVSGYKSLKRKNADKNK